MRGNRIYDIIGKYLAKETSEVEDEIIKNWLNESKQNKREFEMHKDVWEKTQFHFISSDSESVFKNVLNKIDDQHELEIAKNQSTIERRTKRRFLRVAKIAASLLLLTTIGYFLNSQMPQTPVVVVKTVKKENVAGQKLKVFLPDGSQVWLNSESKISYPEKFEDEKRVVQLEGEAFFDVVKNPNRPFIVRTGNVSTTVLGTSFNVQAFRNESITHVALQSGKVKVEVNDQSGKEEIFLEPGEGISYDKSSHKTLKAQFDEEAMLSWKDGILVFKGADLDEIVGTLNRWYGVNIIVENHGNEKWEYEGSFDNDNLDNVLGQIAYVQEFSYEWVDENKVIINLNE